MEDDFNVMVTFTFQKKEYFIRMTHSSTQLQLLVTDKITTEKWRCCCDVSYIENITRKTGNFKQYHIFVNMLKSGLLKTSDSISLEMLSHEDLINLRTDKIDDEPHSVTSTSANKDLRYLILTYTVEFDRIHYPVPLEYCGHPRVEVLQESIRKLQAEVQRLKVQLRQKDELLDATHEKYTEIEKRLCNAQGDNEFLKNEVINLNRQLKKLSATGNSSLENMIHHVEENFAHAFKKTLHDLQVENAQLRVQVNSLAGEVAGRVEPKPKLKQRTGEWGSPSSRRTSSNDSSRRNRASRGRQSRSQARSNTPQRHSSRSRCTQCRGNQAKSTQGFMKRNNFSRSSSRSSSSSVSPGKRRSIRRNTRKGSRKSQETVPPSPPRTKKANKIRDDACTQTNEIAEESDFKNRIQLLQEMLQSSLMLPYTSE